MKSIFSKLVVVTLTSLIPIFMIAQQKLKPGKVMANGHEFTYLEAGQGPLVILLHGFPDNPYSFESQIEALATAGYHAVAPFKRGFAPGDTVVNPIQHSALYTQDVLALIDAFNEGPVILVGHDWGAGAAYGVAQVSPSKLKGMITMSIPLSQAFFSSYTTNIKQVMRSWYVFFFQSNYAIDAFRNNDYSMIDTLWKTWCPDWQNYSVQLERVKETFRKPGSAESAVEYYRQSFGNYQLTNPELVAIQSAFYSGKPFSVPTLYIHGRTDGCIGVENTEGMENLFTDRFYKYIIPGAGHFVQMEKPEEVNTLMLQFIRSLK